MARCNFKGHYRQSENSLSEKIENQWRDHVSPCSDWDISQSFCTSS